MVEDLLDTLVEFLISTGQDEYLFRVITQVLYDHFKTIDFLGKALKPAIESRKIKYIPLKPLGSLIEYYKS